jgi:hypothetical protein
MGNHKTPSIMIGLSLLLVLLFGLGQAPTRLVQAEEPPVLPSAIPVTPILPGPIDDAAPLPAEAIPTPSVASSVPPAQTGTAVVSDPDACEPNDTPATACLLALDAVSGPFTIVPETDQDWYALDLPNDPALATEVTVRSSAGLDLLLTARQEPAFLATDTFSLTLPATISGRVLLRVEHRGATLAATERYRIEVRRVIAPPAAPPPSGTGDMLENNWSPTTAHPIAVGVVYDLSLVCPETWIDACPGGDHDYLRVPLKGGVPYVLATFDLAPGVDPVLDLFWNESREPVVSNDDYAPGGLLAAMIYTPPTDGIAIVRIGPRNGGMVAEAVPDSPLTYRLAVAPLASELAGKLTALLQTQANVPSPTPTVRPAAPAPGNDGSRPAAPLPSSSSRPAPNPPVSSGSAPPAQPTTTTLPRAQATSTVKESIDQGAAIVIRTTAFRREPRPDADLIADLAPETVVEVRGPLVGMWVSVLYADNLLPGWIWGTDLRWLRDEAAATMTAQPTSGTPLAGIASSGPSSTLPAQRTARAGTPTPTLAAVRVRIQPLDPALPQPLPTPAPRVAFALTVQVVQGEPPPTEAAFGLATPTPDRSQPLAGVHVQLVNAFGDVLAEARTDVQGTVRLSRDLLHEEAVWVRLPAWSLALPVERTQAELLITLPEVTP